VVDAVEKHRESENPNFSLFLVHIGDCLPTYPFAASLHSHSTSLSRSRPWTLKKFLFFCAPVDLL
jgi:hypothetical protein